MQILGISGRKQSGKNTMANILHGIVLKKYGLIKDWNVNDNGELDVFTENSDGDSGWGTFDVSRKDADFVNYADSNMWPYVKLYSFADSLKWMCTELFEIPHECVWGTDEQKDTQQEHLLWENMPNVLTPKKLDFMWHETAYGFNGINMMIDMTDDQFGEWCDNPDNQLLEWNGLYFHHPGSMAAREFMQFLGTEVMRKIYGPIWVNHCMRKIRRDQSELAIVADVRFPDEADAITNSGGKVVRLTRQKKYDAHASECSMDKHDFKYTINNKNIAIKGLVEKVRSFYGKELKCS